MRQMPTAEQEREIRAHLARLLPGAEHPDFPEALAVALADPGAHLRAFRRSAPFGQRMNPNRANAYPHE